jgi:NAD(P)-dependent dehydrogenase (short-subunit alcohol dehydrogenase family)
MTLAPITPCRRNRRPATVPQPARHPGEHHTRCLTAELAGLGRHSVARVVPSDAGDRRDCRLRQSDSVPRAPQDRLRVGGHENRCSHTNRLWIVDLKGKTVVVLGASQRGGSGWATALLAGERGARVVVGARRVEGVRELAAEIDGLAVQCDASVEADVEAMATAAAAPEGTIDIAILSAGMPVVGSIDELDGAAWRSAIDNNFVSAVNFVRQMARQMTAGGSIVIVSSIAAIRQMPGYASYACAKGATEVLVRYAALEYAERGIRVNAVSGGLIDTPMTAGLRAVPEAWNAFLKEIPLGKPVQPSEIGEACLWLSSPAAAVTGMSLVVDNGYHLLRPPQPNEMPAGLAEQANKQAGY